MSSSKPVSSANPIAARSFARRLGTLLIAHGWLITESASYLQVDRSTVTNVVTGRRPLGEKLAAHMIASLAQAPGVSAWELQELVLAWFRDFRTAVLANAPESAHASLKCAFGQLLAKDDQRRTVSSVSSAAEPLL